MVGFKLILQRTQLVRYDVEKPEHILEHSIQQVKKTTQHLTGQMEGLNSLEVNVAGTMGCTITVLYIVNEHTQGYRVHIYMAWMVITTKNKIS